MAKDYMRFTNKDIYALVKKALSKYHNLTIEKGRKHCKIRNLRSMDFLVVPGSPSDHRGLRNLTKALDALGIQGHGLIYSRTCN